MPPTKWFRTTTQDPPLAGWVIQKLQRIIHSNRQSDTLETGELSQSGSLGRKSRKVLNYRTFVRATACLRAKRGQRLFSPICQS